MTRRRVSWAAAAVLLLADLFLHKPISDMCDAAVKAYGWTPYNHAVLLIIAGTSGSLAVALLLWDWRRLRQPSTIAATLMLVAVSYLAHHWLLVANVELIHYPQYALVAGVLLLGGNSPNAAWLAATAAGVIDETYQQLVIYAGRPDTYLDFNDMVLNAIGATWAILLLARISEPLRTDPPNGARLAGNRTIIAAVLLALFVLALWLDPPKLSPLLRPAATGHSYHVFSAAEGLTVGIALWGLARLAAGNSGADSR